MYELASQTLFSEDNLKELASHKPLTEGALKALDQAVEQELSVQDNVDGESLELSVTIPQLSLDERRFRFFQTLRLQHPLPQVQRRSLLLSLPLRPIGIILGMSVSASSRRLVLVLISL